MYGATREPSPGQAARRRRQVVPSEAFGRQITRQNSRRRRQAVADSASQTTMNHSDEHVEAAEAAGLRYVTDAAPGIRRKRRGRGFAYLGADGVVIQDAAELQRIRKLVIPPAWTEVWICPNPSGHLQATGRDARGRKQHRYHPRWREARDANKFDRMAGFAKVLPRIRSRVARDLRRDGLPKDKVVAAIVRLLETTYARVGNEEYARQNNSFGLTT